MEKFGFVTELQSYWLFLQVLQQQWLMNMLHGGTKYQVVHSHSWITVDLLSEYLKIVVSRNPASSPELESSASVASP